jgi:hypothetical protein
MTLGEVGEGQEEKEGKEGKGRKGREGRERKTRGESEACWLAGWLSLLLGSSAEQVICVSWMRRGLHTLG